VSARVAIVTGAARGIGYAIARRFAAEGASVALSDIDVEGAENAARTLGADGGNVIGVGGDAGVAADVDRLIQATLDRFGRVDILVNNAAEQHETDDPAELNSEQLERTFRTNVFSQFHMTRACLQYMQEGSSIINTTSITAYQGHKTLIDYASTKGAIVAFTRSLSGALVEKGIRVNGVAPGPIWTPLIPATMDKEKVASFGESTPLGRAGQPIEVARAFVFLASADASYITGEVVAVTGGMPVSI
jgi:NAD(P)-dependent dehydrogenase (short-subunit alcohol dehydrogenase family)